MRIIAITLCAALALAQSPPKKPAATPRAPIRWGQITGQLSNQSDLQTALDGKQDKGATAWGGIGGDIKLQSDLQAELSARMPLATRTNFQAGTAYTLTASDAGALVALNNPAGAMVTIPQNLPLGFSCLIMQLGGVVTFAGNGAALHQRQQLTRSAGEYAVVSIIGYAPNTYVLSGDMQ